MPDLWLHGEWRGLMADDNVERAKLAYETFRGGFNNVDSFNTKPCPLLPWDEAPIHIREVVLVAYMQGCLDAPYSA